MIVILIITMVTVANCLVPSIQNDIDEEIKTIMTKYISKIPDVKSRYVINDRLSKVINHYFKGKISTLPLYKISLKIDRHPVKIPWTMEAVEKQRDDESAIKRGLDEHLNKNVKKRQYKVMILPSTVVTRTGRTTMETATTGMTTTTKTTEVTETTKPTTPTTPSTTEAK